MVEEKGVFKVPEDGLAIVNGVNIVQGTVKEWFQVILIFAGGESVDDLI